MTSICQPCKKKISRYDDIIQCQNVCQQSFHLKCVELTLSDKQIMEENEEKWHCDVCMNSAKKTNRNIMSNLKSSINIDEELIIIKNENELLKKLNVELKNVNKLQEYKINELEREIKTTKENNNQDIAKETYSSKVKKNNEAVVIIKPINTEQNSIITKEEVKKNLNPVAMKIGITSVRNISEGGVVIGCGSKTERDQVQVELNKKISQEYRVELPKKKNLKLKILQADIQGMDEREIETKIKEQNNLTPDSIFKIIKIVKNTKFKPNIVNIIIEVDKNTNTVIIAQGKIKVGWKICSVIEYFSIIRCYKCQEYGHFAKECKNKSKCVKCNGEHSSEKCPNPEVITCPNCTKANEKYNLKLDTNHKVYNTICKCYERIYEKLKARANSDT